MAKSSEHATGPFIASAFRVRQFVRENFLANRPYVSLWFGKTYMVPAGMYAGQVWGRALNTLKRARNSQAICKCGT
eukprot:382949-Pelagomonas_calceolata.AAC.1